MELTKTKLNKILKKYRYKLESHNKEWEELCKKNHKRKFVGDSVVVTPLSIYDYEKHNSRGAKLFKDLMKEFDGYEVFPKKRN